METEAQASPDNREEEEDRPGGIHTEEDNTPQYDINTLIETCNELSRCVDALNQENHILIGTSGTWGGDYNIDKWPRHIHGIGFMAR